MEQYNKNLIVSLNLNSKQTLILVDISHNITAPILLNTNTFNETIQSQATVMHKFHNIGKMNFPYLKENNYSEQFSCVKRRDLYSYPC